MNNQNIHRLVKKIHQSLENSTSKLTVIFCVEISQYIYSGSKKLIILLLLNYHRFSSLCDKAKLDQRKFDGCHGQIWLSAHSKVTYDSVETNLIDFITFNYFYFPCSILRYLHLKFISHLFRNSSACKALTGTMIRLIYCM